MDSSSAHWSGPLFGSRVVVSRPIRVRSLSRTKVQFAIGDTKRSNVDHVGGSARRSPLYRQGSQASYLIVERTTETARRACSSRAMRYLQTQVRPDTELSIKCTNFFQVCGTERCLPRSLTQGRILSALGSLSRGCRERKKAPITTSHKYWVERISWQSFSRGFLESTKSPALIVYR